MSSETGVPMETAASSIVSRVARFTREHLYMVGLLLAGTLLGAVLSVILPMDDIPILRRVLGGAVAGFYFALFPLGYRLLE